MLSRCLKCPLSPVYIQTLHITSCKQLWFSDRAYNYTFVSDVNAHIKGFAEAVLPMPLNNKTQVVLDGFAEAVIRPSMEYRRWSLVAHIWTAGTGAIAMILNLMPWVRTRSYALHRALGYYAVMAVAITCVHLMTIWTVFGQVPVGFWASAGTPLICTEMAACVVLGYRAAVKRDWMAHRAAMMFCAAGMLYVSGGWVGSCRTLHLCFSPTYSSAYHRFPRSVSYGLCSARCVFCKPCVYFCTLCEVLCTLCEVLCTHPYMLYTMYPPHVFPTPIPSPRTTFPGQPQHGQTIATSTSTPPH